MWENVSRQSRYTQCKLWNSPCVYPGQVWHQLIFPWVVSTGLLICNGYIIGEYCVIERWLSNFCLQKKKLRHVKNVMINNAGINTKRKQKLQSETPCKKNASYISQEWYFKWFIEVFNVNLWKSYNVVPNSMQSCFPYSTLTSACQRCACTHTVTISRHYDMYMQKSFSSPKQTILHWYRNEIITVDLNQLQLIYFTNMLLLIPRFINSFLCLNHKYTDWCPNDGGWGIFT